MQSIKVMRRENQYILKTLAKFKEVVIDAHLTGKIDIEQIENISSFIHDQVISYQHVKQEDILFRIVREYPEHNIEELLNKILRIHRISDKYFDEFYKAQILYQEGRYLAIYNIINNAMTYITLLDKGIQEEEKLYDYVERVLTQTQKNKIDKMILEFNREIEEHELSMG